MAIDQARAADRLYSISQRLRALQGNLINDQVALGHLNLAIKDAETLEADLREGKANG